MDARLLTLIKVAASDQNICKATYSYFILFDWSNVFSCSFIHLKNPNLDKMLKKSSVFGREYESELTLYHGD